MAQWFGFGGQNPLSTITSHVTNVPRPEQQTSSMSAEKHEQTPTSKRLLHSRTVVFDEPEERERRLDTRVGSETRVMYENMRKREREVYVFNPSAEYIESRRFYVDWICELAEEFRLHTTTGHVAVHYFDRALQICKVQASEWQLLALTCLRLSAKFEEKEEAVPSLADVANVLANAPPASRAAAGRMTAESVRDSEIFVLFQLDFKLTSVCSLHCLEYWLGVGVLFNGDRWRGHVLIDKIPKYVRKYAVFFANLCLQDYKFARFLPSHLGAAIICAARRALCVAPLWRDELAELTAYSAADVSPVYDEVWAYYEASFPGHARGPAGGGDAGDAVATPGAADQPSAASALLSPMAFDHTSPKGVAELMLD